MAKFIRVRESHRGSDKFTYINVDHIRCVEDISGTSTQTNEFLGIPNAMSAIHIGHRMTIYSLDTMEHIMDMIRGKENGKLKAYPFYPHEENTYD